MTPTTRYAIGAALTTAVLLATNLIPQPALDEDVAVLREHCEMVQLWTASNGEYGWPDYNDTAHLCADHNQTNSLNKPSTLGKENNDE